MKIRKITVCGNCRIRKLGCDGKSPACTQCVHTGRQCGGYPSDFIFVENSQASTVGSLRLNSRQPVKPTPFLAKTHNSVFWDLSQLDHEASTALIIGRYAPWLVKSSGHSKVGTPPFEICGSWVGVLPKLLERRVLGDLLPLAVLTLALSIKCKDALNDPPTSSCAQAHCLALSLLRKNLLRVEGPIDPLGAELVAASMCLTLAEFMIPTSNEGRLAHLKGVGKVLQLSGAGNYSAGLSYQLFMGIRPLLIFEGFQTRTSSFLALPEWQTIPFKIYPASPLRILLNHAALIPSLLERFDVLVVSRPESKFLLAHQIWFEFGEILELLDQWERLYRQSIQDPPYWPRAPQNISRSFHYADTQESFWFPDMFVANAFTLLWALRLTSILHREQLETRYLEIASQESIYVTQQIEPRIPTLAAWICKSMEFLIQDEGRLYAQISTLFPLRVVYNMFEQDRDLNKDQLAWCQNIVDQLVFKGIDLSSLL